MIVPVATLLAVAASAGLARLPPEVEASALAALSAHGEVLYLPRETAGAFAAVLVTRAEERCETIEASILDVENYPKRFTTMRPGVRVLERSPTRIRYEFELSLMFSPKIQGVVERPRPGRVQFVDEDTGGLFAWDLVNTSGACHMQYGMYQPQGKQSGFVALVRRLEPGVGLSAELAAGLASARGFARPENKKQTQQRPDKAWNVLAAHGTVLQTDRTGPHVTVRGRRQVAIPARRVVGAIRHRLAYAERIDFIHSVTPRGTGTDWDFRYFGGQVTFRTETREHGSLDSPGGLVIEERVTGGDLRDGLWRWTVREVPDGAVVDLDVDVVVSDGSIVLRTLTAQDPTIADATKLQVGLRLLHDVIGPDPVHAPLNVATVPQ